MSQLDTIPGTLEVGSNEIAIYNFDVTAILGTGESLQSLPAPTATLTVISTASVVPNAFIGAPGVSGNLVQINLNGLALQPKQSYYLVVSYYTTATKRLQFRSQVNCVL